MNLDTCLTDLFHKNYRHRA